MSKAQASAPPPHVNPQDPLPEASWFWRRVFIFATSTCIILGIWMMVNTMVHLAGDQPQLIVNAFLRIISMFMLYAWCNMTYYVIAPSAEQVVKLIQTAAMLKSGVVSTVTQIAEGRAGAKATAQTVVGKVVAPPGLETAAVPPSSETGLPDNEEAYTGPPNDDVPSPPTGTPEEAPWPLS